MNACPEIIERIKKLLRLARSSNPHEAKLALARAMELAREHRVAVEGLNPDNAAKEKATTHRETVCVSRVNYDKRYALLIVRNFFRVTPVEVQKIILVKGWPKSAWKIVFVGSVSDIEIGLYVYAFLTHHFNFCWQHRAEIATARGNAGRLRNRHAFVHGMMLGIFSKLSEQMPAEKSAEATGLELMVQSHHGYISAVIGETSSHKVGAPDHAAHASAWAGYQAGLNTEIRPALKPSDSTGPLALTP